jgi:hypothetical protein
MDAYWVDTHQVLLWNRTSRSVAAIGRATRVSMHDPWRGLCEKASMLAHTNWGRGVGEADPHILLHHSSGREHPRAAAQGG